MILRTTAESSTIRTRIVTGVPNRRVAPALSARASP
jgi:hypothetical protein